MGTKNRFLAEDGGSKTSALVGRLRKPGPVLMGPELPVAGVAEAGDDVALLVEVAVDGRQVDRHVGVGRRAGRARPPGRRSGRGT